MDQQQNETELTLSQAIRKGATLAPQIFNRLGDEFGTCAIGAAYHAVFGTKPGNTHIHYKQIEDRYQKLKSKAPLISVKIIGNEEYKDENEKTLWSQITILNDTYKLTREEIANLLEQCGY